MSIASFLHQKLKNMSPMHRNGDVPSVADLAECTPGCCFIITFSDYCSGSNSYCRCFCWWKISWERCSMGEPSRCWDQKNVLRETSTQFSDAEWWALIKSAASNLSKSGNNSDQLYSYQSINPSSGIFGLPKLLWLSLCSAYDLIFYDNLWWSSRTGQVW